MKETVSLTQDQVTKLLCNIDSSYDLLNEMYSTMNDLVAKADHKACWEFCFTQRIYMSAVITMLSNAFDMVEDLNKSF